MQPQTTTNVDAPNDEKVLKVFRAIRQVESQGDYNAIGDGGASAGAFQWNNNKVPLQPGQIPARFNDHAREAGVQVNDFSRASQNKVAYSIMKKWKDVDGLSPEEIAAKWNGASKDPATGRLVYNNPDYGVKFRNALAGGQAGGTYNPPPEGQAFQPSQSTGFEQLQSDLGAEKKGFLSELGQDFSQTGQGVNKAITDTQSGAINPASGVLQGAGAIAGTVGNVVDTTLSNLPFGLGKVYQGANDLIGGAVQGAAETAPGQAVVEGFNKLSPEVQGNIGAAGNIASVIPFFKAFGAGRQGLKDAMTTARRGSIENDARGEITDQLTAVPKRSLDRAESRDLDPMGVILKNEAYIPGEKEVNGKLKWDSEEATNNLQKTIDADEQALQNLFESQLKMKQGVDELALNINDIRERTLADVLKKSGLSGSHTAVKKAINDYFDSFAESLRAQSGREFVNLSELNNIKRDIRDAINFDAVDPYGTVAKQAKADAGSSLMKQVEEAAEKIGIEGVKDINKKMAGEIQALNVLKSINDKTIRAKKEGLIKKSLKGIAKEVPLARRLVKDTPSTATSRLKRKRPLRQTARKGLVQLAKGQVLANQVGQEQQPKNI